MLPLRLAAAVVVVAVIADWPARNVARQTDLYKYVYSSAAAMLATVVANQVMGRTALPLALALFAAGLAYMVVGASLVAVAMLATGHGRHLGVFLKRDTHSIELCTIALGIGEVTSSHLHLPLVWLSFPAAVAIQQWSGRQALKEAGQLPEPMTERVWLHVAGGLVSACSLAAVLRIDTRNPVALRILTELRSGCDVIGSFGAGLAILLVDCPDTHADALGLRAQAALTEAGVHSSVAVVAAPRDGSSLDDLLVVSEAYLSLAASRRRVGPRTTR